MASALSTYVSKDLFTDERLTILFIPDEVISEHESTLYQLFNNSDDFIKHVENKLDKQVTVIMVLRLLPVDSIKPFLANLESLVQIIALHIFCTNVELYTLLKAEYRKVQSITNIEFDINVQVNEIIHKLCHSNLNYFKQIANIHKAQDEPACQRTVVHEERKMIACLKRRIDHGLHDIKKKMNKLQRHERVYERQKRDLDRRDSEL
ncbi:unnamed protein product, partial [Didymodactylos carnosus]